jgi:arylformamidase
MLIDISPKLEARLAVWPGDVPFSRTVNLDIAEGANITLSSVQTTLHAGAHADAPSHYARDGRTIERQQLELYYGPCDVVRVRAERGARLTPAHFADAVISTPRVLVATGTFPDPQRYNDDFASFAPETIAWLASRGVRLIGIDTPSVDAMTDKVLLAHTAIHAHDMAILEGLVLDHVAPGVYTLIALPLPIVGGDASPVRAVLAK